MAIKLKRLGTDEYGDVKWGYRDLIIERHRWILPYACISYEVVRDGKDVAGGFDTLREVRSFLAEEFDTL